MEVQLVALNSSINYLGSSVGATLGGVVISLGMGTMALIYFAIISMIISLGLQFYSMRSNTFNIATTKKAV